MKKGVIIVLSLLVVGLGGYIVYDKCLNKTESTKTEVKKDNVVSLYVDNATVKNVYSNFDIMTLKGFVDDDYFGYFFKKDKTLVSDIPNSYKALIAIMSMYDDKNYVKEYDIPNEVGGMEVKASDVENKVKEIFGNVSFKNETTPAYACWGASKFTYNEADGYYRSTEGCGLECNENEMVTTTIVKAETVNDKTLNIYVKPEFKIEENACGDDSFVYQNYLKKVYSDINMTNLVASLKYTEQYDKSYTNKLDTYKFSFEKDGSNYYFKSVEKVK